MNSLQPGVRVTERPHCCPLEPKGAARENTDFHDCDLNFSGFKLQGRLNKAGQPPEHAEQRVGVWTTAAKVRRANNRGCGGAIDIHKIVARSLQTVAMKPTQSFHPCVSTCVCCACGKSPSHHLQMSEKATKARYRSKTLQPKCLFHISCS